MGRQKDPASLKVACLRMHVGVASASSEERDNISVGTFRRRYQQRKPFLNDFVNPSLIAVG